MSHRTRSLPPLTGLSRIVRELRYHEASRQVAGVLLCVIFALAAEPLRPLLYAATPLVAVGIAVRLWAAGVIVKDRELATGGPYVYVRHPHYVGNILVIAGFVLASGRWWAAAAALAFLLFFYPPAVRYEERKLRRLFGADWDEYAARTRPLLPRLGNRAGPAADTPWSLQKCFLVNFEPVTALFLLAWFVYIFYRL